MTSAPRGLSHMRFRAAGCADRCCRFANVFFENFIRRSGASLKVYHATEDYLSKPEGWVVAEDSVRRPLLDILQQIDLLVAVSPGVADSYRQAGRYSGRSVVLPNGCDFEFWKASGAAHAQRSSTSDKIALFGRYQRPARL